MLHLDRRLGEKIRIGDAIVVTLVDVRGEDVVLGFEAPADVPIHRREVREIIRRGLARPRKSDAREPRS